MKTASVYRLGDRLLVHAGARTTAGVWIAAAPFLPLPLSSAPEAVAGAVLQALAASADGVPHPADWRAAPVARLSAAGVRSERAFRSGAVLVEVGLDGDGYRLEPHAGGGAGADRGFHPLPGCARALDAGCGAAALGSAVLAALDAGAAADRESPGTGADSRGASAPGGRTS